MSQIIYRDLHSNLHILRLELKILKAALRPLLLTTHALSLDPPQISSIHNQEQNLHPALLRICRLFYLVGLPMLYSENTITSTDSMNFDTQFLSLPVKNRQMITGIRLEVDWAHQLWAKFPLIAVQIEQLRHLQKLVIVIVENTKSDKLAVLGEKNAKASTVLKHGPGKGLSRESSVGDAMLKAEKKMLKELVGNIKSSQTFRLDRFRDEAFAAQLSFGR